MRKAVYLLLMLMLAFTNFSAYAATNGEDGQNSTDKVIEYADFNSKGLFKSPYFDMCPDFAVPIDIGTLRFCFPDKIFNNNLELMSKITKGSVTELYNENIRESRVFIRCGYFLLPLQLNCYTHEFYTLGYNNIIFENILSVHDTSNAAFDIYTMLMRNSQYESWLMDAGYLHNGQSYVGSSINSQYVLNEYNDYLISEDPDQSSTEE